MGGHCWVSDTETAPEKSRPNAEIDSLVPSFARSHARKQWLAARSLFLLAFYV